MPILRRTIVCFTFIACAFLIAEAKFTYAQVSDYSLDIGSSIFITAGDSLPFWFVSNRYGQTDPASSSYLHSISGDAALNPWRGIQFDVGGEVVMRYSMNPTVHFNKLYLRANYGAFRLSGGRFDQSIGLNNHDLSIGSMMVSRNATPVPMIQISTPNFTTVPGTGDLLDYKIMLSHGWLTDVRYVNNSYLHQKYIYIRLNLGNWSGIGGIVHNTQWGGTHPVYGRAPKGITDYFRVFFARAAEPDSGAPMSQVLNTIGNSVAAYEFALEYRHRLADLRFTRLFYLEDKVSTRFRSPWDGVWGLNITFRDEEFPVTALVYEHINTRRQDAKSDEERGRAIYYNHSYYKSGWTYEGRVLGIPLITRDPLRDRIDNNIIVGHHLGVEGKLYERIGYRIFASYSRNYGTAKGYEKVPRGTIDFKERRRDLYTFSLETLIRLDENSSHLLIGAAFDAGRNRQRMAGFLVGLRYSVF